MAFEDLKENLSEAEISLRTYLANSQEYYKLKGFKFLMQGVLVFAKVFLVGLAAAMALFFLSLAASFGIGRALDNTFYGFLIVGGFYCLLGLVLYLLRGRLNKPLLQKFSEFYFDEQ